MVSPCARSLLVAAAIGALACACGGAQKSTNTADSGNASGDPAAPSGAPELPSPPGKAKADAADSEDLVTLEFTTDRSTNNGRPFRVVVRAIDYKTYLEDTYASIADMVMSPNDSVQAVEVIHPSYDATVQVKRPEKNSLAIYFLFTNPGASWKTYLDQPVDTRLALSRNGVADPEPLPTETGPTPKPPDDGPDDGQQTAGSDNRKRKKQGLLAGGLGAASALAGSAFGLVARQNYNQTATYCNAQRECTDQTGVTLSTNARRYGWAANIGWAVGAVGVFTGAVLAFTPARADQSDAEQSRTKKGLIITGIGGAALLAGAVLGVIADDRYDQTFAYCDAATNQCTDQAGVTLGTAARRYGWAANISFAVGAVGVVAGSILLFKPAKQSSSQSRSALQVRPFFGPHAGAGATLHLRF